MASGGLCARLPDIQSGLRLDDSGLGLVLLGFALGTGLTFVFASRAIESLGTRRVLVVGIPLLGIGTALLATISIPLLLFDAFVTYGALYGLTNIAMNVEADRIEAAGGDRVMNSCHGLWSLGYLAATLTGTVASAMALSPLMHLGLVAGAVTVFASLAVGPLRPAAPRPHAGRAGHYLALPTIPILLLVAFVAGPSLLEGSLRNWSIIYMRDSFSAPAWVDTLTLPVFLLAQSAGRLMADRLVMRYGLVRIARLLTAVAFLGLLLVIFAPTLEVALAGFLLIGFGVCVSYPLTTSAAAKLGDRPSSQNVASLTLASQVVLLGAPAALGFVAQHFGLRATFASTAPPVAAAIWLARFLGTPN